MEPAAGNEAGVHAGRTLEALPYLDHVPVSAEHSGKQGVGRHLPARAWPGLNLYVSRPRPAAMLMTMEGETVHTWSSSVGQPTAAEARTVEQLAGWHHVEPLANGDLLAIVENRLLLALDRRSAVKWTAEISAHHDIALAPHGAIWTLTTEIVELGAGDDTLPMLDDHIVELSAEGLITRRLSVLELMRSKAYLASWVENEIQRRWTLLSPPAFARQAEAAGQGLSPVARERVEERIELFRRALSGELEGDSALLLGILRLTPSDLLHANSIEIVPQSSSSGWPSGHLLISIRNFDLIAVVDPVQQEMVWTWGPGTLEMPHQPTLLASGNVMVFDNGVRTRRSRVLEVDPTTGEVVWEYAGEPASPFFSPIRGGCEALENGNVLITDSESGRAFEIGRDGQLVWEFFNPELATDGRRGAIYRMTRLSEPLVAWLE